MPKQRRQKTIQELDKLTDNEALDLLYNWQFWARPKQLEPEGDWLYWVYLAGRGSGKTRTGSEFVNDHARQGAKHIALVGQTKSDARDTMVELGPSSILKVADPRLRPEYQPSKRRVVWPNGCIATIYSGDEPGQLRGPSHDIVWLDELAKFKYPQECIDNILFGLRGSDKLKIFVSSTPRPIRVIKELKQESLKNDGNVILRIGSTYENASNLPEKFLNTIIAKYEGTRLGRQEIYAEILDDNPDALWSRKLIDDNRVNKHPRLIRVVVAVDPEASDTETSAETGIIVAGIGDDQHGYIIADKTIKGSPKDWGNEVVTAYHTYQADNVIAEVNNGGDMVEYVIKSIDPTVPVKQVRASRGKQLRAEPVASLDEQYKIHHVGSFPELEDQLCEWIPGDKSPDRLDARVWAITELMLESDFVVIEGRSTMTRASANQDW